MGRLARTSRDPPQEPHYRDAVEGHPSTLLAFHQALVRRTYRRLFSSSECPKQPGPKGPSEVLIQAIVEAATGTINRETSALHRRQTVSGA